MGRFTPIIILCTYKVFYSVTSLQCKAYTHLSSSSGPGRCRLRILGVAAGGTSSRSAVRDFFHRLRPGWLFFMLTFAFLRPIVKGRASASKLSIHFTLEGKSTILRVQTSDFRSHKTPATFLENKLQRSKIIEPMCSQLYLSQ